MEIHIKIKGKKDTLIYKGDRIDILDYVFNGTEYKQIRFFKNGISKSELVANSLIQSIIEK